MRTDEIENKISPRGKRPDYVLYKTPFRGKLRIDFADWLYNQIHYEPQLVNISRFRTYLKHAVYRKFFSKHGILFSISMEYINSKKTEITYGVRYGGKRYVIGSPSADDDKAFKSALILANEIYNQEI